MIQLSVALGAAMLLTTELLGALGILSPVPLLLVWAGLLIVLVVRMRRPGGFTLPSFSRITDPVARLCWLGVAVLLLGTLVTGMLSAPNAWDSLTYHLPRVERWAEQGTLQFWPTSVDRQLWMSPWTEYAILHLRLLTGGDRLAALPSWAAYLGCIGVTASLVRLFQGTDRQVAFGALVSATLPVAVLHASSTQTDLPAAFWVLCTAALILEVWLGKKPDWRGATWIGLAAGLAVATKGTAWLALAPWLALYAGALWRAGRFPALGRAALMGLATMILLDGPTFLRNAGLFGDPLGDPSARQSLQLTPLTPGSAIANLLANASLHLGVPWSRGNLWLTDGVLDLQRSLLGVDPGALFPYFGGFHVGAFSTHESLAGNPMHLGLVLVVVVMLLLKKWRPAPAVLAWCVAGLAGLLIHGVLIRWQPFGARLQLPVLVWLAPVAGIMIRGRTAVLLTGALLLLAAIPALLANNLRPLLPMETGSILGGSREDQYFAERRELERPIDRALADLRAAGCEEVGLSAGYDAPEYLLRALARIRGQALRLRYVSPVGPAAGIEEPRNKGTACAIIVLNPPPGWTIPSEAGGMRVMWKDGPVALLLRPPRG